MHTINLLIKPVSGNCNLRCSYCFYSNVIHNRVTKSFGFMDERTISIILEKVLNEANNELNIAFQGGEPTLIGLPFYKKVVDFVDKTKKPKLDVTYSIQTNGMLLDNDWAKFFSDHQFLVGLSLDGIKVTNDIYRIDAKGEGTFKIIMHSAKILANHGVDFNILTVVTKPICQHIRQIYTFYRNNNFLYQQYIPWIPPFEKPVDKEDNLLSSQDYGEFLRKLFDLWYLDKIQGKFIYIRYFDNLLEILQGYPPQACELMGRCTYQYVVEADGSVYCCDFYVIDKYKIGNFLTDDFHTIENNRRETNFIQTSMQIDEKCKTCKWWKLCRGGCRRYREPMINNKLSLNMYCDAFSSFLDYSYERLLKLTGA